MRVRVPPELYFQQTNVYGLRRTKRGQLTNAMIQSSFNTLLAIGFIFAAVTISLQGERIDRLTNRVLELESQTFELKLTKKNI